MCQRSEGVKYIWHASLDVGSSPYTRHTTDVPLDRMSLRKFCLTKGSTFDILPYKRVPFWPKTWPYILHTFWDIFCLLFLRFALYCTKGSNFWHWSVLLKDGVWNLEMAHSYTKNREEPSPRACQAGGVSKGPLHRTTGLCRVNEICQIRQT